MVNTKILVVDDAFFMRTLLGNTLKDLGYDNVEFAEDGMEAIEKAKKNQPDVVTLDISMPEMDGLKAIEEILQVSNKSKIIMVSAITSQKVISQAIDLGAIDYIPKPFSKKDISKSLERYFKSQEV
ncbi:UNVERIFIED_CONTAM: two-component system chemotaxis response regulator CheY [Acetivibrio alkalicellulosi]